MSENRLAKNYSESTDFSSRSWTPFFVSDSKGSYLNFPVREKLNGSVSADGPHRTLSPLYTEI